MLLCAAGVGLAALLYYYFAAREERERMAIGYAAPSGGGPRPRRQRQRCSSRYELEDCSICQEIVAKPTDLRTLACGHHFHFRCIDKWLEASPVPTTCPNCRQVVQ